MLATLIILLKKDAILAYRNKIWTAFELFLPIALLVGIGIVANQGVSESLKQMEPADGFVKEVKLTLCPHAVPELLITGDASVLKGLKSKEKYSSEDEMRKKITQEIKSCTEHKTKETPPYVGLSLKTLNQDLVSYTIITPAEAASTKAEEEKDGFKELSEKDLLLDPYGFSSIQNNADFLILKNHFKLSIKNKDWSFKSLDGFIQLQGYRTKLFYLPIAFGACLLLTVVNIVRSVVTEKSSVKAYLEAMGLPKWMFYCEHLIAASIKTIVIVPISCFYLAYVLKEINTVVLLSSVLVYALGANSFALFLSTFFKTSKRATEVTVVVWILLFIVPSIFKPEGSITLLCSLNINYAFHFFIETLIVPLLRDTEFTFNQMFSSDETRHYPGATYFGFMIFDMVWMYFAAIAIDNFKNKIDTIGWTNFFKRDVILTNCAQHEKVRDKAVADIDLKKLVKIYPTGEKAVNGLTLRALRGQVSILLGHNGCGKSTTFSMISGINRPTSGSISIGGINAIRHRSKARAYIGMCPQYNPIFEKLTVMEHLHLVNALKGGHPEKGKQEAIELLTDIGLLPKKDDLAGNLSGGMKRKLCVCMAMINKSKVVLLDEPTAGMDPGARQDVQRMLEKTKKSRTILLTTHYMDEAERLGDWIFVMSHGKMAAYGTSAFLKSQLGSGFLLTVVLENKGDKTKIYKSVETVCRSFIKKAEVKDVRGQMMEITIPEKAKGQILELLKALEAIKYRDFKSPALGTVTKISLDTLKKVHISTLGLALDSLEQVFIKIGEECKKIAAAEKNLDHRSEKADSYAKLMQMKLRKRRNGTDLQMNQFFSLIKKRFRYSLRNYDQYMNQVIVPIVLLIALCQTVATDGAPFGSKAIKLSLDDFPKSLVYFKGSHGPLEDYLKGFKQLTVETTSESNFHSLVRKHYNLIPNLGFIVEYESGKLSIHYNPQVMNGKPILTNALANMLLIVNNKGGSRIETEVIYEDTVESKEQANIMVQIFASFGITSLLSLVTSPFVIFLIEERVAKYSHQQLLTGVSQTIFWAANVLYDLAFFALLSAIMITIIISYEFIDSEHLMGLTLLFTLYFYALVPIIYTASSLIDGAAKASIFLIIYQVVLTMVAMAIIFLLMVAKKNFDVVKFLCYSLVPTSGFYFAIAKLVKGPAEPNDPSPFLKYENVYDWDGIGCEMTLLAVIGTIFLCVFFMLQVRRVRRNIFKQFHPKETTKPRARYNVDPCPAVFAEEKISRKPHMEKTAIVLIKDLVRQFGTYRAVNGICLTVKKNECFGMLGTNGAGKTTTFDILTGLRFPSGGAAFVDGRNVSRRTNIGYCPQFDAILQEFTGREVLELIANLHGYHQIDLITKYVLSCVGMTEHAHKRVRFCSGGQKRKISVGIALLSRSHCVILDEPTAGIDPDARRDIWETLVWLREKSGCSIVLTSHSMEECEALCSRIAILKKGEVIALGTSQDLKSQYGFSYSFTLVMNSMKDRKRFCQEVKKRIRHSVLKTAASNKTLSLNWQIPKKPKDKWSSKFFAVQKLANDLKAKDFMLAESSLEDTFILLTSD